MNIWLVLWVVVSAALLVFLGWTLVVLQKQKSVWKAFAAKNKLRYKGNALMQSPQVDGSVGQHKISFFTGEHLAEDVRGVRKLTAIEVNLNSVMPVSGGVATAGMVPLVKALQLKSEIRPAHKDWSEDYIAASDNRHVLEAYLTDERLDLLTKLMKIKGAWVVFIFRDEHMLLRLDIASPLNDAAYLERLSKLMLKTAEALEIKSDEMNILKSEAKRVTVEKTPSLEDAGEITLELEEDEGEAVQEEVTEDVPELEEKVAPVSEEKPKKKVTAKKTAKKTSKKTGPKSPKS